MKKIAIIIIVLAVIAGLFFIFRSGENKTVTYETTTIKKGSINTTVTATGTIEPITKVDVGTQVSGTISRLYVDYNSVVKKGQLIAELDRTLLEAAMASDSANMESSKSEYEYQKKNFARLSGLHEKRLISDTEFETAQYEYEKAKLSYEKAIADLVKAKSNLSYATIYSPIDGVVLSREVEEGQTVAASFETPTMFTIANDLRKMQVIADVDEADIGQVEEGATRNFYRRCLSGRYIRRGRHPGPATIYHDQQRCYLRSRYRCAESGFKTETGPNSQYYGLHDGETRCYARPFKSLPFYSRDG